MRYLESPHFNARPLIKGKDKGIDMIVLHAISLPAGSFDTCYIDDFFLGNLDISAHESFRDLEGVRVSAHFVVDRKGKVTQFVPCEQRAWHAGKSSWLGRDNCNDYAIGIEMIGDEAQPFTKQQYRETARLCRVLMQRYTKINADRIVGHQDIAPGRKWDPGVQWDWTHFHRSLQHIQKLDLEIR